MDEHPAALWRAVARRAAGDDYAERYAARFDELARGGGDIHGEADFVHGLLGTHAGGARILDAGCGTGRIGARLAEAGHRVVGVDADEAMVEVARGRHPECSWFVGDLAMIALDDLFDLVVCAGNVVPFVAPTRWHDMAARIVEHLRPGGLLVSGFGLTSDHLPPGCPPVDLADWDRACVAAGLVLTERHAGWDGAPYDGEGYAVSVYRVE